MIIKKKVCFSLFLVLFLSMSFNVFADQGIEETPTNTTSQSASQSSYLPRVTSVSVQGNQIISTNTVINKIKTQRGMELSREVINEDIKRLYASGYFQDVTFDLVPDGSDFAVVVKVEEKPVVKEIRVKGNEKFSEDAIRDMMDLKTGNILDRHVLKEDINKIAGKYHDKGFKFVKIDHDVDVNQITRQAVIDILVKEGGKYKIDKILFNGVNAFKTGYLKGKMKTKEKAWWLLRFGVFKEKYFSNDIERLKYLYQKEGYLDVSIESDFEYNDTDNKMNIILTVSEGQQYVTGDVKIVGNELYPESELWGQLEMLPGEVYSQIQLHAEHDALRKFYFEKGYINAQIQPQTDLNKDSGRVDIVYEINEGDLFYIDKVKIRGNTKTKDNVIRRELRIRPAERFDGKKLEYSKQRLENLGYFDEVSYETEPGSASNKRDLIFNVKEKQTGELSFGAGVSSIDQFIGFAEITQRNFDMMKWPTFTGGGQKLSLSGRMGSVTKDVDISFTEPYVFGKNLSFGVNIFNWEREGSNVDFDTRRRGFKLTLGKRFTDKVKGNVAYTLESVKLKDIDDDAHPDVTASGVDNTLSRFEVGMSYDTRDNVFNPKSGWFISSSLELVGSVLGGDEDYYNAQFGASRFFSFFEDHTLELRGRVGVTDDFGDSSQVPIFDRFYAGGLGTVRGFNYRRVGPKGGGDAIGGESLYLASAEYVFPIIENFKGAVFMDAGHVNYDAYDADFSEISVSVGPGIKINTPLGPITFYYGYPIANKDTEDENGRLEFNLSRGF